MASYRTGSWGSARSTSRTTSRSGGKRPAPGYQTVCNNFNKKIESFKRLTTQAVGPAKGSRPSPATLNSFGKWIDKGAIVQRVSPTQVKRWAKNKAQAFKSATSARTVMQQRFGKGVIKAVTNDKTGGFLGATAPTWKGKTFKFPS